LAFYSWQRSGADYKPAPTGLSGSQAVKSEIQSPQFDAPSEYAVLMTFAGADADRLRQVTQAASSSVVKSQTVPPEGHIGIFLGLTDQDLTTWDSVKSGVMEPVPKGGKLVSNPAVLEPINSGQVLIWVGSDRETGCSLTARTLS
jgi:hypothetical protein